MRLTKYMFIEDPRSITPKSAFALSLGNALKNVLMCCFEGKSVIILGWILGNLNDSTHSPLFKESLQNTFRVQRYER